jgi:hypothetical protein
MTDPLVDDDLRAMLEERASRISPDAAREAMSDARSVIRGPAAGRGGFAVRAGLGGRGSRLPVGLVAAGMVAVLVVAIAGGREATTPAATIGALATPHGSPVAAASSRIPSQLLSVSDLRSGMASGALDGRTVALTGIVARVPCSDPSGPAPSDRTPSPMIEVGCWEVRIVGPSGITIAPPGGDATSLVVGSRGLLAATVEGGRLVANGWLANDPAQPWSPADLSGAALRADEVAVVGGWLITPAPDTAYLADSMPAGGLPGVPAAGVAVDDAAVSGPDASQFPVMPGTYLARPLDAAAGSPAWQLVATVAGPVLRLQGDEASTPAGPATPAPGDLDPVALRAAIADDSLDGRVLVVDGELEPIQVPCREPGQCTVLALHGLEGIVVTDERRPSGSDPGQLPGRGPLVLTPHHGALAFLGIAPAGDRTVTVADLADSLGGVLGARVDLLEEVSGWLVADGIHSCPLLGPGATPCPGPPPWLTDDRPSADGMRASNAGIHVGIADPLAGDRIAGPTTAGPFLVRHATGSTCDELPLDQRPACAGGRTFGWEVVAVLGNTPVVHATLP